MSRQARLLSEYLHVVVCGIGKHILFEDDADRKEYLLLLKHFRDETGTVIVSYCPMEKAATE